MKQHFAFSSAQQRNLSRKIIFSKFWEYASPNYIRYIIGIGLMLLCVCFDLIRPILLKISLDKISANDIVHLRYAAYFFLLALILEYFCKVGFDYVISYGFSLTIQRIRIALFQHVINFKMAYWDQQQMGSMLTRVVNDTDALREFLNTGLITIIIDVLTIIGVFGVMLHLDWGLSPIILISFPIVMLVVRWLGKKLQQQYFATRATMAHANAYLAESIQGVEILQIFQQREYAQSQYEKINQEYRSQTIWLNTYDAALYAFVDCACFIVIAILLYLGFGLRFSITQVTTMMVYMNLIERIFIPIRDFSGKLAMIQQAIVALDRVFSLLNQKHNISEIALKTEEIRLSKKENIHFPILFFKDVSFAYRPDSPQILHNINLKIDLGQTIALVGPTGSGKSTIAKIILRIYDGYTGNIFFQGKELRNWNTNDLRQHIAIIPQDVSIFPGTLRENITLFRPNISDEKIYQAIKIVQAQPFLANLTEGLDFFVKENGSNLSVGQLQLIAFARALVLDTNLIVMDEATSYMDSVTEAWIHLAISQILQYKTVLIIAHRLATIAQADQIFVIQSGEITQSGTSKQLLEDTHGYYYNWYQKSIR